MRQIIIFRKEQNRKKRKKKEGKDYQKIYVGDYNLPVFVFKNLLLAKKVLKLPQTCGKYVTHVYKAIYQE